MTDLIEDTEIPTNDEAVAIADHEMNCNLQIALGASEMPIGYGIDICKQWASEQINNVRDVRIAAGVEFPENSGTKFDSDLESQKNINGAVTMFIAAQLSGQGETFSQEWIRADNTKVILSGAEVTGLGMAIGKHVGFHRLQARTFKDKLASAETPEALQAVIDAYELAPNHQATE